MTIQPAVQALYDGVSGVIQEHNKNLADEVNSNTPGYVDPSKFLTNLKIIGGTSEERLRKFSWEEILDCLPNFDGIKPKQLAKDIANIFRHSSSPSPDVEEKRPIKAKKVANMNLAELVESFDPEDYAGAVAKRLVEISRGQKFVVYADGRVVDTKITLKLLQELKQGYPEVETHEGKRVYKVGVLPDNFVDENPIYSGRPLRPDGTCDQLNRSWEGISKQIRQFVAFALQHRDGPKIVGDQEKAWALFDLCLQTDALKILKKRYAKVAVDFEDAEKLGKLPLLQIKLGDSSQGGSKGPFDKGQRVEWSAETWVQASVGHPHYKSQGGTWTSNISRR